MKVYQYIPFEHVQSLQSDGVHFSKCSEFVDLMEFRLGYLFFKGHEIEEIQKELPSVFENTDINEIIDKSFVSCWTEDPQERYFMWESFGKRGHAIRISVDRRSLAQRFTSLVNHGVFGSVIYNFRESLICPEFLSRTSELTEAQEEYYHLFFHKHPHYRLEDEFRLVCFTKPRPIPIRDLIREVVLSPFATWSAKEIRIVEELNPTTISESKLEVSYSH